MKAVAVVTQKGGAGKTTVSLNLAVAAEAEGERVLVLDLDPQRSAHAWYEDRQTYTPVVLAIDATNIVKALPQAMDIALREGFTLVIIDTPGRDALAVNAAMQASDLCLVVTRPTLADLRAQWATVEALKRLEGKRAAFVLNQCHYNGRRAEAVKQGALAAFPFPVIDAYLANRVDYQDAYANALGVTELEGSAAGEVRALWFDVHRKLEKRTHV